MLLRQRDGDHGAVCKLCGITLRSNDAGVLHIMFDMHFQTHVDTMIEGAEDLLRRCAGE
jgi:hypothetical protein